MKKFFLLLASLGALSALAPPPEKKPDNFRQQIEMKNWILAQPNGEPITVLDLTKKMEVVFRQQFPQFADSADMRFQFYNMAWRQTLDELVNNRLIIADAEDRQIEVSDGEVRRELEKMFGPNVVKTIDELGLTHEEAWDLVKTELLVDRMRGALVYSRAFADLTPERIQEAYADLCASNAADEAYSYRVLTIRHKKKNKGELAAERAQQLLDEHGDLEQVRQELLAESKSGELFPGIRVSVTGTETRQLSTLAAGHKEALLGMEPGSCSAPVSQWSRADKSTVFRIFYLEDHGAPEAPLFAEVEERLKDDLMQKAAAVEYDRYVKGLRSRFEMGNDDLAQLIPDDFQPFQLY